MRYVLAGIWLMLWGGVPGAAEVEGLYRIEASVQGRDDATRAQDLRRALERVLKRVASGPALASAAVRAMLAKPETYVLQFEYESRAEAGRTVPVLRVDFDPARIADELRRHGHGVWGAERPELLVGLTLQDGPAYPALTAEKMPDLERQLDELSAATGLPVITPLWDLADQQALGAAEGGAGTAERIRQSAERYETDTVLTGRLAHPAGKDWTADWWLYRGDSPEHWRAQAADFRAILDTGLNGAYTRLAARLIPRDSAIASLELTVTGIATLDDANRVAAYLGKLSPVTQVEWQGIGSGDAAFRVKVRGGREAFRQAVAFGHSLRPVTGDDTNASRLTYEWLP